MDGTLARPKSMAQRFVVLDFYRYVAAIGVFLFHIKIESPASPIPAAGVYGLFVDMFFILSGFVIFYTYRESIRDKRDYRRFVIKRLARVYPLHIIVLTLFVGGEIVAGQLHPDLGALRELSVNAALLQAWGFSSELTFNTPAWSISAELACYLVFPLIAAAVFRLPILLAFALVALGYIVGAHGHIPMWANEHSQMYGATFDFGIVRALAGFINGVVLCRLYTMVNPHRAFLPVGIGAMIVAIVIMNVFAKPDIIILLMAIATLSTALGEAAIPNRLGLAAVFEWFGNTSYSIYMLHWALVIYVVGPLLRSHDFSVGVLCAVLLAFIAGLTVVSRLVYITIESPARRWVTNTFAKPVRRRSEISQPRSAQLADR